MTVSSARRAALAAASAALAAACAPRATAPAPAPASAPSPAPAAASAPNAGPAAARTPRADSLRAANQLDVDGRTAEARALFAALVASAPDEAARAAARRATAMSYAFDGDCANAERLEQQVIAYWRTREAAEPQNAFYQQGEMANEAARVCIDAGRLDDAERLYRLGAELGNREPAPRTHPASLWAFRTEHALARLAARRGRADDARRHVAEARRLLDADTAMARGQRRFLPTWRGTSRSTRATPPRPSATCARAAAPATSRPLLPLPARRVARAAGARRGARAPTKPRTNLATGTNPPAAFTGRRARKLAATGRRRSAALPAGRDHHPRPAPVSARSTRPAAPAAGSGDPN
jgi:tetratricopeptide (TPR) repeat protein